MSGQIHSFRSKLVSDSYSYGMGSWASTVQDSSTGCHCPVGFTGDGVKDCTGMLHYSYSCVFWKILRVITLV